MKGGTSPEVPKARESRGEPRVEHVRGSGPCRGVIERPGGSRHDRYVMDRWMGSNDGRGACSVSPGYKYEQENNELWQTE